MRKCLQVLKLITFFFFFFFWIDNSIIAYTIVYTTYTQTTYGFVFGFSYIKSVSHFKTKNFLVVRNVMFNHFLNIHYYHHQHRHLKITGKLCQWKIDAAISWMYINLWMIFIFKIQAYSHFQCVSSLGFSEKKKRKSLQTEIFPFFVRGKEHILFIA